jgi:hypothetical protein
MLKLSEKINQINKLPEIDNKDVFVMEIEALESFTEDERYSIFGNGSILWIVKNFTIAELKKKATKALTIPEIKVGDVILYGPLRAQKSVVLEVTGKDHDRLTIIYKQEGNYEVREGVSIFDVDYETGKNVDVSNLLDMIK